MAEGGWTYRSDGLATSFNNGQVLVALKTAAAAGIVIDEEVTAKGSQALHKMRTTNDLFPYTPKPGGWQWMTTEHGSVARDPLCSMALLNSGKESGQEELKAALERFMLHARELQVPRKKRFGDFNKRGHGSYFFFYAHYHALRAANLLKDQPLKQQARKFIRKEVLNTQEFDGSFLDHYLYGPCYGTGKALSILAQL